MKEKHSKSNYTWIIDPIDGTKNFIMGIPTWSNLVGLYYKDKSIISLVNFPLLNTYYLAFNRKAYKFEKNKKKLIKCNKKNKKKPNIVLNTLRSYKKPQIKKIENKFKGIFKVSGADALNFCLVSEGKIDILIEKGLKKVDFFPLMSIIENSGALITDWNGGKKFKNGDVLVSGNKRNHLKILKILKN
jgi:myo-inositol-1(or 4)-monophosphatase